MDHDQTTTRLYADGKLVARDFDDLTGMLTKHPGSVLWIDLYDPEVADLAPYAEQFGLHPLAVEDAVQDHERPKLDRYPEHLFLNLYAVEVTTRGDVPHLSKTEISAFVTDRALITVHKSAGSPHLISDRIDRDAELAPGTGVGFLVYAMLDVIVDGQFDAALALDEAIDRPEDLLLEEGGAPRAVRRYAFAVRRILAGLRRGVVPMTEVIAGLQKTDLVGEDLKPYFRDIDDHARQAALGIDTARDRINGLLEADLNEQSNALNDITRKLAAWAAVIAVPTLITGWFGQNIPFPGFERLSGFWTSTVLLIVAAGGLYAFLKARRWL